MKFLHIIAWIFAVLSSGLVFFRFIGWSLYSERDKLLDNLRGFERSFSVVWPGILAIVCWAWIISGGM